MSDEKWTDEQRLAIFSREDGILVNAAAGSGKTAVLSRRVAALAEEGKSLERLLVVTFTRAAAAEMRQRIESALAESYERTADPRILEQKLLVGTAKICTIDSFFNSLLKENFQKADLSPDFSTLDAAEEDAITAECLDSLLEEQYETFPPDFRTAVSFLGGEGNDDALKKALKDLYIFLSAMPSPEKWKEKQLRQSASPAFWKHEACNYTKEVFSEIYKVYKNLLLTNSLSEKKAATAEKEAEFLKTALLLAEKGDWDALCTAVNGFAFERLSSSKKDGDGCLQYKAYRGLLKDFLKPETNAFGETFLISEKEIEEESKKIAAGTKALFALTDELEKRINAEYAKRNRYSFNALSRKAKNLLAESFDPETGEYTPTPLADALADSFDEVLIDEYQDVNDLQDLLFRIIGKNGKNLFVVGDVKQSIYGFRLSNPKNFIRKKSELNVINLNQNFRSRENILEFSNFVFSRLFNPAVTEIAYDNGEALRCGSRKVGHPGNVEVCLLQNTAKAEEQARFCAEKIKAMLSSGCTVLDKNTKEPRPVTLSDFAVLLRTRKPTETFLNVFAEEGIPLISPEKPNFWKLPEVQTVLAALKIINNPYDDSAVFGVMFSEMFSFTADEIALMKQEDESGTSPLFALIEKKSDQDAKCADFTRLFRHFVIMSRNLPVYKLIWQILIRTGYLDKVSFLPEGDAKRECLLSLYAFARSHSSADSLLKFIKLAQLSSESAKDSEKQELTGNAVRIMTMHSSKGLEFPVCILPLLEKSSREDSDPILLSEKFGVGLRVRDEDMTYEVNSVQRKLIAAAGKKKDTAEELRLLYVALTRPRDRLILVSAPPKTMLSSLSEKQTLFTEEGVKSALGLTYDNSLLSYLLPVLSLHPCGEELLPESGRQVATQGQFTLTMHDADDQPEEETVREEKPEIPFSMTEQQIKARFAYRYPGKLTKIPAKVSVTELSKGFVPDPDSVPLIPPEGTRKPSFLQPEKLSGAEKGTAMHTFLRFADFNKDPEEEIARLLTDDFLSEEQANSLNRSRLKTFFTGEVPNICAAAEKVLREEGFVVRIPASFFPTAPKNAEGEILMQGAIDLLCFTDGGIVVIDYKTDRLPPEQLAEKYGKQVELYCYAAEKMFALPIKRACLWSFAAGKLIDIPQEK